MQMLVRKAKRSDLPVIADIHIESWRDAYKNVLPKPYLNRQVGSDIRKLWLKPEPCMTKDDLVLVAKDAEIVGFIAIWCRRDAFVDNLHVKPAYRSKKIGRILMKKAAGRLVSSGKKRAYLWVFKSNGRAIQFYEELGGVIKKEADKNIFGHIIPSYKMVWDDISVITST